MRKFNLFFLIDGGDNWGGAESNLLSVARCIDKERYNVEIGCLVDGRVARRFRYSGLPVTVIDMKNKWDIMAIARLIGLLKGKEIDVIHTSLYPSNTFGRIAAILARTPITVVWEQAMAQFFKTPRNVWVDRILNKFTDAIIVPSQAVRQSIVEVEKIGETKIHVVYNCVEPSALHPASNDLNKKLELGLRPEDRVLPYIANLGSHKGHKYFLPAIKEVVRRLPEVKFLFVGEGPLRKEIEKDIERLGLKKNVYLFGFRRDVDELLSIAEFYVHPTLTEALGVALLEAMTMGKAVVASKVDGIPEVVIEGETGLLVPPRDPEALSNAIVELLERPSRAKEMGQKGRERALNLFGAKRAARELEEIYEPFILAKILLNEESPDEEAQRLRSNQIKEFFAQSTGRREKEWFASDPILTYEDKARQRAIFELVKPESGEKILEVGCGDGSDTGLFSSKGVRCISVDYDHRVVSVAKERLTQCNGSVALAVADGIKLPFKDCSFDKVSCSEVLEHIPEYKKALKEIHRVLKPGGKVVITVPNRRSLKGIKKGYNSIVNKVLNRCDLHPYDEWKTRNELKATLQDSGLMVKEELGVDFVPRCFKSHLLNKILIAAFGALEAKVRRSLPGWGNTLAVTAVKESADKVTIIQEVIEPRVSVIIPTLDGSCSGNVARLLEDIRRQTFKDLEVILVKGVRPNGKARNKGVTKAQGDYLVLIDDDTILGHERVIENLIGPLAKEGEIGMTGASPSYVKGQSWCARTFAKIRSRGEFPVVKEMLDSDYAQHACCALRKEVYIKVGWESDDLITGTDDDLRHRLHLAGYRVVIVPDTWVYRLIESNLSAIARKSFKMGLGSAYARKVHPEIFAFPRLKGIGYQIKTARGTLLYEFVSATIQIPMYLLTLKPLHSLVRVLWTAGFLWGWLTIPYRKVEETWPF
jgi:glycosyltransferase involved in cell wall biosynthesis/ubiquinone/menaquinone biosynthesis C-methylase UbiE